MCTSCSVLQREHSYLHQCSGLSLETLHEILRKGLLKTQIFCSVGNEDCLSDAKFFVWQNEDRLADARFFVWQNILPMASLPMARTLGALDYLACHQDLLAYQEATP